MQPEGMLTAVPAAPDLILLPSIACGVSGAQTQRGDPSVLGLSMMRRTILAAHRANYGRIFFLARDRAAPPGATAVPDWSALSRALASSPATSLIIAPATILSEIDWLKRLARAWIEPAAWAAIPRRIIVLAATAVPDALGVLHAEGGAFDLTGVYERLTRRFGPAAAIPSKIDPMVVAIQEDIRAAERRLLRGLVKETDGFMARHFDRRISLQISRRLAPTCITPNQVTLLSIAIGLCGAPFFLSALWYWQTLGALFFLFHSIVDGCDGELARLKFEESKYGGILDFWGDNIVHIAIFGCMAVGWALSAGTIWPLCLGIPVIMATLGSAGFVYWRKLLPKDGSGPLFTSVAAAPNDPLAWMLDAASRRDFIYIVPIFALFGKASWVLVLATVGTPTFCVLLLFLALRERLQSRRISSRA